MIIPEDWVGFAAMWLRGRAELASNNRIYAHRLPATKTYPLGRVSRIGGGVRTGTMSWVHDPLIQFDFWSMDTTAYAWADIAAALMDQEFHGLLTVAAKSVVVSHAAVGGVTNGYDPEVGSLAHATFTVRLTGHPAS